MSTGTIASKESRFRKKFNKEAYDFNYDRIFNKASEDSKEIKQYNKSLLEVADQKLKRLIETQHDINHPGPYFDIVNKQLDYVNTLKERIKILNEKINNNK